jgi:signal transduction histidine kinase
MQKAETDQSQSQIALLNKDDVIQKLEIKKQKLLKNYFLSGLFLFSILAFFIYNHYITRQKLKLQALRIKIASDLHDDVGGTLSSISIFAEMAKQQSKEVIPMLDTIGESSRNMLDAMADIVWTINPENDQFAKIILRMRGFAYDLLGAKKIDFEFLADEELAKIKLPMEVRKNLYLIFKEATNNMVKYSHADRAVFSVNGDNNNLVMMIRDNGLGFDMSQTSAGNGLTNMKRRAEEMGGKLNIESRPGEGTTIYLNIALRA